jgi:two-component system response regulator FixJ
MEIQERLVHIIDDHADVRTSLTALLTIHGFRVLSYDSAKAFLAAAEEPRPSVVVMDLRMPDMDGLEALSLLKKRDQNFSVILMSAHGDVSSAVSSLKLGAVDFLQKPFSEQTLLSTVATAFEALEERMSASEYDLASRHHVTTLSPREKDVMQGLIRGESAKLLAHRLAISVRTVEMHRARAMARMECKTLTELIAKAVRGGVR